MSTNTYVAAKTQTEPKDRTYGTMQNIRNKVRK